MANVLKLKRSAVARRIPGPADLTLGELALNTWDGRLFGKKNDGADAIVEFLSSDGAFKPDVRAATMANITLAGIQTVDSVVLAAGDRVLVRSQHLRGAERLLPGQWHPRGSNRWPVRQRRVFDRSL